MNRSKRSVLRAQFNPLSSTRKNAGKGRWGALDGPCGGWRLDRASYQLYSEQVRAWLPAIEGRAPTADALALADAVEEAAIVRLRMKLQSGSGRTAVWLDARSLLIVWEDTPRQLTALVAGPGYISQ